MNLIESDTIEFKREYTDEIKREVVGFLNTKGGEIYVGVEDDSTISGVADPDDVSSRIVNSCYSGISPDCALFMKVKPIVLEDKNVVYVKVMEGNIKPYYLKEKGLKPSGVYVRVGTSTIMAGENYIRSLIKESDNDNYLDSISLKQDLTFEYASEVFKEKHISFTEKEYRTLGLVDEEKRYTNLAVLLSDQCEHSIKVAIFQGKTKTTFLDRKEFTGCVFKQLEEVNIFLNVYNKIHGDIIGLETVEKRDYPQQALREGLLNALIHREYSFSGSILVNLYEDRLEIVSLGGIVKGISLDSILSGISQPRNDSLSKIFYRLRYVDAYGTGIPRIMDNYEQENRKPFITNTDSSFMLTLPNRNYQEVVEVPLTESEKMIYSLIQSHPQCTRKELMEYSSLSSTRCFNLISSLIEKKKVEVTKKGKQSLYIAK